jgi:hypothetical protein
MSRQTALRFATSMSTNVIALHVYWDEQKAGELRSQWATHVEAPARGAGIPPPELVLLASPYRRLFKPIVRYIDELRQQRDNMIAVIFPDLVEGRWWEYLLHTHRADVLRTLLMRRGNQRVVVISVPWYIERRLQKR